MSEGNRAKRILIAVGGSGGHIYPAQAVAEKLLSHGCELFFIGGNLATNAFFTMRDVPFHDVPCGSFAKKNPLSLLKSGTQLIKGCLQSRKVIADFKPDLIVGFGSHHAFPPLMAARTLSVPLVLHEANAVPGKVNRFFSRRAKAVGIYFPDAASLIEGHTIEVAMPLRTGYEKGKISKEQARESFGLSPHLPTLLVFGGSQGALALNRLVCDALVRCTRMAMPRFQVLHFTGDNKGGVEIAESYSDHLIKAYVKDFEGRMDVAWAAADLVVGRSGASTIGEQMAFEVPGILIPYPHAADDHQDKNADFMAHKVRGCFKYSQGQLTADKLADVLRKMFDRDQALIKEMRGAIQHYKRHNERRDFADLILELAEIQRR
jgi:UDP-N-acetylglucosamine--N-acetylmuramyl-(pentapeptide) pyrophosphoryl-undecaprenol N-acetylglucosamine transferase